MTGALIGDRIGRKSTLVASLMLMGGSTLLIAFLPTYAQAGWIAPALLCLLRFGQGFGLGGEWGGAALLAVENEERIAALRQRRPELELVRIAEILGGVAHRRQQVGPAHVADEQRVAGQHIGHDGEAEVSDVAQALRDVAEGRSILDPDATARVLRLLRGRHRQ